MKDHLFEEMTGFGLIFFYLGQMTDAAFKQSLSWKDLLNHEHEIRKVAGFGLPHPSQKSPLIPFIEAYFKELKSWMSGQKNGAGLLFLAKVIEGEETEEYEIHYDPSEVSEPTSMPTWYSQVLELGELLMTHPNDLKVKGEKLDVLLRNIPGDTTLGILTRAFFAKLLAEPPNLEQASYWWSFLKGKESFECKVKVKGLYTTVDF